MHTHHQRDECMDPKHHPEHGRADHAHKLEIHLPDQRTRIHGGRQRAEHADLGAELGPLALRQRDETLRGALAVRDEGELGEAGLEEDPRGQRGQVEHAHLPDVPGPHARVAVREEGVLRGEAAAVVAEPDVVGACFVQVECEGGGPGGAEGAGGLEEAVHEEDGVAALFTWVGIGGGGLEGLAGGCWRAAVADDVCGEGRRAISPLGFGFCRPFARVEDVPE